MEQYLVSSIINAYVINLVTSSQSVCETLEFEDCGV